MLSKLHGVIPKQRLLVYLLVLGFLPLIIALSHYFFQKNALDQMTQRIAYVQELSIMKAKKESVNNIVRNHFKEADHFFIDKHLETLPLMTKEVEALKKITQSESFTGNGNIEKRLNFLTKENHLLFKEISRSSTDQIQEVVEGLSNAVEINPDDLLEILSRIEEKDIGEHCSFPQTPQLIITEFSLNKKTLQDANETLVLNLKLLKREFL